MPPKTFDPDAMIDYREFYRRHVDGLDTKTGLGHCPFHDDENESFSVDFERGLWNCFASCGSGNVVSFVARWYGIANRDAFIRLAREYGDGTRPDAEDAKTPPPPPKRTKAEIRVLFPKPTIPEDVWEKFPPIPDAMMAKLAERRGWTREAVDAIDARLGTFMLTKDGRLIEDRKRNRVAIPVRNAKGELVNIRRYQPFGELLGEWTDKTTGKPRKESKIYSWGKDYGSTGYLFHCPDPDAPVVHCEGEPDFVAAVSRGANASTLTSHPDEWPEEFVELHRGRTVVSAMDADTKGLQHGEKVNYNLAAAAHGVVHVRWPEFMMDPETGEPPKDHGKDLTDFFQAGNTLADLYALVGLGPNGEEHPVPECKDDEGEIRSGVEGCGYDEAKARPVVDHNLFQLDELSEIGWQLVRRNNDPPTVFHHGSHGLCTIGEDKDLGIAKIQGMRPVDVKFRLARFASWMRSKSVRGGIVREHSHPPDAVCADMLAEPDPPVPPLRRVVGHPFFDRSGNLHLKPGYDESSRCFYHPPNPVEFPPVPEVPTREDVEAAVDLFVSMLFDFPFVSDADHEHAIAFGMSPFVREMIDGPTPIHLFSAPQARSGKSKMVENLAFIASGRKTETAAQCRDDDEWRKAITAALQSPGLFFIIDNLRWKLDSGTLANALTNPMWHDRILKESTMIHAPIMWTWAATGNNPNLSTEIAGRTVRIHIDAGMERPGERDPSTFRHPNLNAWVVENRPRLVWAYLVFVRNWIAKGRPEPSAHVPFLGGFESWRNVVGGIMEAAGFKHFLGNQKDVQDASDSETPSYEQFVLSWWQEYRDEEVGVAELYELVIRESIPLYLGRGSSVLSQKTAMGTSVLRGMKDRQYAGFRISKGRPKRNGTGTWKLTDVSGAADADAEEEHALA